MESITNTEPYRKIEHLSKLSEGEFLKYCSNNDIKPIIREYCSMLVRKISEKFGKPVEYSSIPNFLFERDLIDPSLYPQLKEMLLFVDNLENEPLPEIYYNLIRILETIEEAYEQIDLKFSKKRDKQ
ncbi:hypothetical protein Mia14_0217 [Candidatus Mancarchaeum acidiphilum]|uniref:Uncharacterized protein n=1 Tax=Candidatus Mancarchaeum acidiphilum TaxID=1920749 RepID=A0A218NM64_9ARCH|nr:hypothetical protein [Candidatus Mancarchaeum acidiphilum]ASI13551.1 hypothetical protein Mia14_0217 [Candidatus Mancarchaeum acidiphilum]